jgi:hypothetical protein
MKLIKIIVNELPESCADCTFSHETWCKLKGLYIGNDWINTWDYDNRDKDCPLDAE